MGVTRVGEAIGSISGGGTSAGIEIARGEFGLPDTTNHVDTRWWGFSAKSDPDLNAIYSVGIFNIRKMEYYTDTSGALDPHASNRNSGRSTQPMMALYPFVTPPQSYEISEPAATQIVPTQNGGRFIESHGNLFKDIRVAGTVGFRPGVPPPRSIIGGEAQGVLTALGGPTLAVPDFVENLLGNVDERGLNPDEVTGFEQIIFLRNMFRRYYDLKQDPTIANELVMVWQYTKEAEFWVVEPINFTTTRDSSNPLSWNYSIQLRTVMRLESMAMFRKDPDSLNFFQRAMNLVDQVISAVNDIVDAINTIAELVDFVANLPANIMQGVLGVASRVMGAAANVKNSVTSFKDTVTQSVLRTGSQFAAQAVALFGSTHGEESVLVGTAAVTQEVNVQEGSAGRARNALLKMQRSFEKLTALDGLWVEDRQIQVQDYAKAYLNERDEPPFTAGSPLNVSNIKMPASGYEVRIADGDDIRTIAKKHLGDEAEWKKIAILNNLKPPYISAERSDSVKEYGDPILIPLNAPEGGKQVGRVINPDESSEAQTVLERRWGRDIRLRETGPGMTQFDLDVSPRGDLEVIEGAPNVEQAIHIKFSTEQGELATHPTFGAKYPIGIKVSLSLLQQFAINVRRTLLSDPRVSGVGYIRSFAVGDRLQTKTQVQLRGNDAQLPITFAVRRG